MKDSGNLGEAYTRAVYH